MRKVTCFVVFFLSFVQTGLRVQGQLLKGFPNGRERKLFMKVTTDDHIYKGRLYYVNDSSIRIMSSINYQALPIRIDVSDIEEMPFKRKGAMIRSIFKGLLAGAICRGWLPVKIVDLGFYVSDKYCFTACRLAQDWDCLSVL